MKKWIIFFLLLIIVFTVTGCNADTIDSLEVQVGDAQSENQLLKENIKLLEQQIAEKESEISELKNSLSLPNWSLLEIYSSDSNSISYAVKPDDNFNYQIIVINSSKSPHEEPAVKNEMDIDTNNGKEKLVFTIIGSVYNFQFINVEWDEKTDLFVEKEIIKSIPIVTDSNINIMTVFPEGVPSEKITWEDETGKLYEHYISYNGLGVQGEIHLNN